jgi:hypothetical protein
MIASRSIQDLGHQGPEFLVHHQELNYSHFSLLEISYSYL